MRTGIFTITTVALLLAGEATAAPIAPIASAVFESFGGRRTTDTQIDLDLDFIYDRGEYFSAGKLFDQLQVNTGDVGRVFWASESTDPQWAAAEEMMTNGNDNVIAARFDLNGPAFDDSAVFGSVTDGGGVDLEGFDVGAVAMTLERLDVSIPGDDPNGDGIWRDIDYKLRVDFYAQPFAPADFNRDGEVDVTDLGILAGNWQGTGTRQTGDANGDGFVNVEDLGILATHWPGVDFPNNTDFPQSDAASSVPEPALGLLATAGLLLARRRH